MEHRISLNESSLRAVRLAASYKKDKDPRSWLHTLRAGCEQTRWLLSSQVMSQCTHIPVTSCPCAPISPCPHIPMSPCLHAQYPHIPTSLCPHILVPHPVPTGPSVLSSCSRCLISQVLPFLGVCRVSGHRSTWFSCTSYLLMGVIWLNPTVPRWALPPAHPYGPRTPVHCVSEGTEWLN